ncbi:hypothetical protein SteCoe_11364 [Stentor coeruleus]|uniref:Uncharacterized protein n=1 Tax=Stentor coeruleus TaxID=5963 RepID=A0A1R2CDC5_9CILI|nr:hypothetical protein SteCoe_11364 [Stentor coeruleus]
MVNLENLKEELVNAYEKALDELDKNYLQVKDQINKYIEHVGELKKALEKVPGYQLFKELDTFYSEIDFLDWHAPIVKMSLSISKIFKLTQVHQIFLWEPFKITCSHSSNDYFIAKCKKFHCRMCLNPRALANFTQIKCACGVNFSNKDLDILRRRYNN